MELLPEDVKNNIYRANHEIEYSAVVEELEECFFTSKDEKLGGDTSTNCAKQRYCETELEHSQCQMFVCRDFAGCQKKRISF